MMKALQLSWNSLNQRHEVVTWNAFQLSGVPFFKVNLWNFIPS